MYLIDNMDIVLSSCAKTKLLSQGTNVGTVRRWRELLSICPAHAAPSAVAMSDDANQNSRNCSNNRQAETMRPAVLENVHAVQSNSPANACCVCCTPGNTNRPSKMAAKAPGSPPLAR